MWNCLWGHALKRSPGIISKTRVWYPGPGFLSSATWPSLPKMYYNGLMTMTMNSLGISDMEYFLLVMIVELRSTDPVC